MTEIGRCLQEPINDVLPVLQPPVPLTDIELGTALHRGILQLALGPADDHFKLRQSLRGHPLAALDRQGWPQGYLGNTWPDMLQPCPE